MAHDAARTGESRRVLTRRPVSRWARVRLRTVTGATWVSQANFLAVSILSLVLNSLPAGDRSIDL